jgi:predicted NodU family carbamoyl transferase
MDVFAPPSTSASKTMRILGIVTRTHDSGLVLLESGVPKLILEEERFNRVKHTRKFPIPLSEGGI